MYVGFYDNVLNQYYCKCFFLLSRCVHLIFQHNLGTRKNTYRVYKRFADSKKQDRIYHPDDDEDYGHRFMWD